MSGETEKQVSGWTVDTLKEYVESLIDGNDKRYEQRFEAQESATKYAQEKSNEFRGSLDDIGKKQMPRTEAEALIKATADKAEAGQSANSDKIDALQARLDRNEGRGLGLDAGWKILIAAVGLIATLITVFFALRR